MVPVAEYNTRMEAEIIANLLCSFGMEGWIHCDDLGGLGPAQSLQHGVRVLVATNDAKRARSILRKENQ